MSTEAVPTIVAPAMRFVRVADTNRSTAFYRDVLGFVEQEFSDEYGVGALAELVFGAARIQLCPPGQGDVPLILFFETNDVVALRNAVLSRGGTASSLQKVNWIKMEMFEIRDPDGHTLWFGQSFDQPALAQPPPMLKQALPHLPLNEVTAGVAYYLNL